MTASLDALSVREFPADWPENHRQWVVDSHRATGWHDAWQAGSAPLVGLLGEGDVPLTVLDRVLSAGAGSVGGDERLVANFPLPRHSELPDLWQTLPPSLAVLCVPPPWQHGALFRRSAVANLGGLPQPHARPGEELFWQLTWQLLQGGGVCNLQPREELPDQPPVHHPPLTPTPIPSGRAWLRQALQGELPRQATRLPGAACDRAALQAGVWQLHGELDESHRLAQAHEGQGKYQLCDQWHAIMHRREPDYGNAKYWVRQLPHSPHWDELGQIVARWFENDVPAAVDRWRHRLLGPGGWKPLVHVELAQAAAGESTLDHFARRVQWAEMLLLLRQTWQQCQSRHA